MITVYNQTESSFTTNGLAVLQPLSCDLSITINEVWSIELIQPIDEDGKYKTIEKNNILKITDIPVVREQTNTYQLFRIYDTVNDIITGTVKAIAFPVAFEATYDAIIEELKCAKKTATAALQDIMTYLSEHGVTKYTVTSDYTGVTARQRKGSWTNTNLIAAINGSDDGSIINHWGGEVAYDNYHIIVNGKLGADSNAEIRCGKNLTGLSVDADMSGVVTRLYPISSDNVRLQRPEGNATVPYVDSAHLGDYPYVRAAFLKTDDKLVDTTWEANAVNTDAAIYTHQAQIAITNKVKEYAQTLWVRICAGEQFNNAIFVEPEWLKSVLNDVVANLQKYFTDSITHPTWKNLIKTCIKDGFAWIKDEEIEDYSWDGNYNDGYTYGNTNRTFKNQYVYVDKRYRYFNSMGEYEPWKDVSIMDWIQPKNSNTKEKFGDDKRYMAKDTHVYTWNGEHQGGSTACEYWFDADGMWDGVSETETEWDWHDEGTYWWFGEDGASESDKNKYAHDCWLYIWRSSRGLYYFDEKGKLVDDLTILNPNWDWREADKGGKYYFGDSDKTQNSVYLHDQWLRIDGIWRKFDSNGLNVKHDVIKQALITALKNAMNTGLNSVITAQRAVLDDVLYTSMIEQCNKKFEEGYDLPVINITANIVDLSKTAEYADFADLETIHLGDKVKVIDYVHGFHIYERVVGLKYDCIRGYNTEVTINDPSRLLSQMNLTSNIGSSGSGTTRMDYVAGDNVTINNNVINVSTPSGDVYAGDQVSVSQTITRGRKIAGIYVNGVETPIYGGDDVSITPRLNQGTKVADYSINGNSGSLYAPSGLQYWTETEKKINKLTSVALPNHKTWDCDDEWKTTGFELNFAAWDERYPYLFAKTDSELAFGFYDIISVSGRLQYQAILISTTQLGACVEKYMEGTSTGYEYELDGLTFYKTLPIDMPYPNITPAEAGEPIFHSGNLRYLDYASTHEGQHPTIDEALEYFLDVSNFRTRDVYYSGIGNNNEYVIWGGYSKKSNPEITDMPFYVTDDGIIVCKDIYIDSAKPIKDIRKNGTSIVDSNQIANITNFTGSTSEANGAAGLVPAPLIADRNKYLGGDGTWHTLTIPEIEANPSESATETLEKVEIDGTVYEIGGESNLEDLEDVNINNVVDGEILKYDATSQKWINGTGGGGASEIVTNIMSDHSRWATKVNTSQTAGWNLGTDLLGFSCSDSSDVGAQAVYMNAIPETVKMIRFKIDARTNYRPSASVDYDICIGIKSTYDNTNFSYPSDTTWITKKTYSTEQGYFEGELDIVATAPFYLYVLGHSWNLDIQELKLIEYAGGGGSDEPQKIDMFGGASTITPTASNGITISTSSVSNMVGAISGSEWSNGYEGFNIQIKNLSIGKNYILKFDWKFTNTAYFVGQYVVGYKLFTTNKSNYDDWGAWDENLDRDDLIHSHELSFQATTTTMYLCFNLCGCSDDQVNYWDISNLYLLELPSGNVEANPSGTATEILTKLKVDNVIYSIPSGGSSIDYSTLEQDTGMKWVDGKEIYQKTYYIASVSTGGNFYNLSNSQDNVDSFVSYEWMATRSDGKHIMNNSFMPDWLGGSTGISEWDYDINHIRVKISAEYYSLSDVYITVRYTKRTS